MSISISSKNLNKIKWGWKKNKEVTLASFFYHGVSSYNSDSMSFIYDMNGQYEVKQKYRTEIHDHSRDHVET